MKRNLKGLEFDQDGHHWTVKVETYPDYWLLYSEDGQSRCLKTAEVESLYDGSIPPLGTDSALDFGMQA